MKYNNDNILLINRTKEQIAELSAYFFVLMMFVVKGLGLYEGQLIYNVIFIVSMIFVCVNIVMSEYTIVEFISLVFLGMLAVIINRISGEKGPVIIVAIIVAMRRMNLKRAMVLGIMGLLTGFIVSAASYMLKVPDVRVEVRENRLGLAESLAWNMGQPHPNTASVVYLAIVAMLIFVLGKRYNYKHVIAMSIGNTLLYFYCTSNTGAIVCELLIVMAFMTKRMKDFSCLGYLFINMIYPFFFLFSTVFPWAIPRVLLEWLYTYHYTLYSRIMLSREFVTINNLSLFGVNVSTLTDSRYTLDNSMLYCIVFNGLLFSIIISIGYIFFISRYVKEKRNLELIITACFLLEGIFEPLLFNTSFKNITLFFLGECVWSYCLKNRKSDCELICIAGFLRVSDKIKLKVDFLYNKVIGAIDKSITNIEGKHSFTIRRAIGACAIALAITVADRYLWPITEDIFKPSGMYDVLVQYNELDKGIVLETMRRSVFVFLLSFGTMYLLLSSRIRQIVFKGKSYHL